MSGVPLVPVAAGGPFRRDSLAGGAPLARVSDGGAPLSRVSDGGAPMQPSSADGVNDALVDAVWEARIKAIGVAATSDVNIQEALGERFDLTRETGAHHALHLTSPPSSSSSS